MNKLLDKVDINTCNNLVETIALTKEPVLALSVIAGYTMETIAGTFKKYRKSIINDIEVSKNEKMRECDKEMQLTNKEIEQFPMLMLGLTFSVMICKANLDVGLATAAGLIGTVVNYDNDIIEEIENHFNEENSAMDESAVGINEYVYKFRNLDDETIEK